MFCGNLPIQTCWESFKDGVSPGENNLACLTIKFAGFKSPCAAHQPNSPLYSSCFDSSTITAAT